METIETSTCRLCLKTCSDSFEVIEDTIKEILCFIWVDLDLGISDEPVVCNTCVDNLKELRDFKVEYMYKEDIKTFTFNDVKSNSTKVGPSVVQNVEGSYSNSNITCNCCMDVVNKESTIFIKNKDADGVAVLGKYFPELVLNMSDDFATCISCHKALQKYITSVTDWLGVEQKIKEYCKVEGTNSKGQIELFKLLDFTSKNVLSIANIYSNLKAEFLEQTTIEGVDTEVKNEDYEGTEKELLDFEENDMEIKTEENHYDRYEDDILYIQQLDENSSETNENVEGLKKCKCKICSFESKCHDHLQGHMMCHKSSSEVMMYACDKNKSKTRVQSHLLTNRNNSKVTMHKCKMCDYQTRHINKYSSCPYAGPSEINGIDL